MLLNALLLAVREIRRNLLRSFLTILGIVIGVSAVITMVTLGNGATQAVKDQISSLGSNLLMVLPGQRLGPGSPTAGAPPFKESDVAAILSQIGGVKAVAPELRASVTVIANGRNWSTSITGTTKTYFQTNNWSLASGRVFEDSEEMAGSAVCLLGQTVRRELFGNASALGEQVRIKQFSCEVIGELVAKGRAAMGNDQDDIVLLPLHTVQRRVVGSQRVATLLVSMDDGTDAERVKASLSQLLRERRKLTAADDDNFNVLDTKQIAETLSGTTKIMTMLLGAVAAVSLLVGGIGIMNIMLVSVTERTREIGLRLAIGALESEVLLQFLIEAVVLSMLGGLIGIVLATAASMVLAGVMQVPYLFNPWINAVSFAFSAVIGVVFGYFPARRAARVNRLVDSGWMKERLPGCIAMRSMNQIACRIELIPGASSEKHSQRLPTPVMR
jgi:putative ABC transport system permease protein